MLENIMVDDAGDGNLSASAWHLHNPSVRESDRPLGAGLVGHLLQRLALCPKEASQGLGQRPSSG